MSRHWRRAATGMDNLGLSDLVEPEAEGALRTAVEASERAKRRYLEASSGAERRGLAMSYLRSLLRLVQTVAGGDVLSDAYGEDVGADDRAAAIYRSMTRVRIAAEVFAGLENSDSPSSLAALTAEMNAIRQGDAPLLLRRIPGFDTRGHDRDGFKIVAMQKLRGLCWYNVLLSYAEGKTDHVQARRDVEASYRLGELRKWLAQIEKYIPRSRINFLIGNAVGGRDPDFSHSGRADAHAKMKADAAMAYAQRKSLRD